MFQRLLSWKEVHSGTSRVQDWEEKKKTNNKNLHSQIYFLGI